jgi:predicted nucleotidyltransferase
MVEHQMHREIRSTSRQIFTSVEQIDFTIIEDDWINQLEETSNLRNRIMIPTLDEIVKISGIHPSRVCVYIFGSRVYGTSNDKSDWDIIMVANNSVSSIEKKESCLIFIFIL